MATEQVNAMRRLGMTEEEIEQVLADDKRIDQGENLFQLSAEQERASKKARTTTSVTAYGQKVTREHKTDKDKDHLMRIIDTAIGHNPSVSGFERTKDGECVFTYNGRKFRITLAAPKK
jgi:hypothetical protein